jgi:hypothetical protein
LQQLEHARLKHCKVTFFPSASVGFPAPPHQASIVLARISNLRRNVAIVGGSSHDCRPSCVSAVGPEPTRSYLQWILSPPPYPLGQTDACLHSIMLRFAAHQSRNTREPVWYAPKNISNTRAQRLSLQNSIPWQRFSGRKPPTLELKSMNLCHQT